MSSADPDISFRLRSVDVGGNLFTVVILEFGPSTTPLPGLEDAFGLFIWDTEAPGAGAGVVNGVIVWGCDGNDGCGDVDDDNVVTVVVVVAVVAAAIVDVDAEVTVVAVADSVYTNSNEWSLTFLELRMISSNVVNKCCFSDSALGLNKICSSLLVTIVIEFDLFPPNLVEL